MTSVPTVAISASHMSDGKEDASSIGASPLTIIVKGGTRSSAHDKARAQENQATELGRAHQDRQVASQGDRMTKDGFVSSHLTSLRMMDTGSPRLVLFYLNRDKSIRQECVAEVVVMGDGDSLFTMVCPKCLERGESHGASQVMVRNSHRKFHIDPRRLGEIVMLTDPFGQPFQVRICGTVTCEEILRCSNVGCTWAVQVSESKVYEV